MPNLADLQTLRRWAVPVIALATVGLRLLGLAAPLGADESGFTLVGRHWHPQPDSVYGPYFVDRSPLLVAVYAVADSLGGPRVVRVAGAIGCGVLVLVAAATARLVAGPRSARWTALCVGAVVTSPLINLGSVKGELLGLPFVMAACCLALLSLRHRSAPLALASGLLAGVAPHLKQSLLGGLVFAFALTVAVLWAGELRKRTALRLALCGLAGATLPTALTVGWALAAGVEPAALHYAVVGFRGDASAVLMAAAEAGPPPVRVAALVGAALAAGLALVIGGFLATVRRSWAEQRAVTAATVALLTYDIAALVASGSYWRDYLFALVPGAALAAALVARRSDGHGHWMRVLVVALAAGSVATITVWSVTSALRGPWSAQTATGAAVREAAEPGDTLTVYGGRADVQLASGLTSPYEHLWSLPMRTLDPQRRDLMALLAGPSAPTWLVAWVGFDAWGDPTDGQLGRVVSTYYERHGTGCEGQAIFLRDDATRPVPQPKCP